MVLGGRVGEAATGKEIEVRVQGEQLKVSKWESHMLRHRQQKELVLTESLPIFHLHLLNCKQFSTIVFQQLKKILRQDYYYSQGSV